MCMCFAYVYHLCAWCLWWPEVGIRFLGTRVTDHCELLRVLGPLQEQQCP